MGRGQVVLITTGLSRSWNTLAITDAVLIFDRLLRAMLQETVPSRNVGSEGQLVLPVPAAERTARFVLADPTARSGSSRSTPRRDPTASASPSAIGPTGDSIA